MKKYIFAVGFMVILSVFFAKTSFADHDPFGGTVQTKVRICHKNGDSGNYNAPEPNISGSGANPELEGHQHNDGTHDGDIIPPFHWSGGSYSGKNWNSTNEAIWRNGCNAVTSSPTPTATATATATSTSNSSPTPTTTPTPTPTATPTVTATATSRSNDDPTPTATATVQPTETPSTPVCTGDQHLDASGKNCVSFGDPGAPTPPPVNTGTVLGASTVKGQVLGVSTMAKTGAVEDAIFNSIFTLGSLLTSFGIMKNGKKKA